jgi:hypothetical protein
MEHLWSLSNMTRVHVDSGLPYYIFIFFPKMDTDNVNQ